MPPSAPSLAVLAHASVLDRSGYARRVRDCAATLRRAFETARIAVLSVESPTRRRDAAEIASVSAAYARLGASFEVVRAWPRRRGLAAASDRLATGAVARRLRALGTRVVHAHGPRAGSTALAAARGTPLRVVVDVHGDRAAEGRLERGEADDLRTPPDAREAAVPARAHGVVYASEALAARFPAAPAAPTGVVPCLVEPALLVGDADAEERRTALRRSLGLSGDEWLVAYAGSLAAWQEVPRVVRLVRHLVERVPQLRFLLLTPDDAAGTRLADEGGLPRGTFRVLSPEPDGVVDALRAADVGALLRRPCVANAVASPTKAAEYLAAGLGVFATDAVLGLTALLAEHPVAGTALPWASDDDVLAARLAGAARPSTAAVRAARRALARTALSGDAGAPVYRRVHGALLER